MKKILFLVLLILLSACSNKYKDLGYSLKASKIIASLSEKDQVFFSEFHGNLSRLLENENFDINNFDTYRLFCKYLDADNVVYLVNNGTLSTSNYGLVKTICEADGFEEDKLQDYLKLRETINNSEAVVYIVNNNLNVDYDYINNLVSDKYFICKNIEDYIKYRDANRTTRELIEYVNTKSYLTYYEDNFYADPDKYGVMVNVNKYYYLGETYVPDDLVELGSYGYGSLRKVAYDAYKQMVEAARADGISFYVTSSYRSYETQVKIYNNYLSIDPQSKVDIYSARPGFSDHQTGYTVDILKEGYDFDNFYSSDASKWLALNAYKYGFICRYPEGLEDATGYEYEPWHYRYVGDIAIDVYKSGVSYDEFFAKYIEE